MNSGREACAGRTAHLRNGATMSRRWNGKGEQHEHGVQRAGWVLDRWGARGIRAAQQGMAMTQRGITAGASLALGGGQAGRQAIQYVQREVYMCSSSALATGVRMYNLDSKL